MTGKHQWNDFQAAEHQRLRRQVQLLRQKVYRLARSRDLWRHRAKQKAKR